MQLTGLVGVPVSRVLLVGIIVRQLGARSLLCLSQLFEATARKRRDGIVEADYTSGALPRGVARRGTQVATVRKLEM